VASGYANSAATEGIYEELELQRSSTIDFSRAAWGGHTTDLTVTYGETAETINSVEYKPILFDGVAVDNFLVKQVSWLKRGGYEGLYPQAGTNIAIQNVTEGQIVVVTGHTGNAAFEIGLVNNGVAEADIFRTQAGSVYTFKCIKDGTLALSMARYGYLDKIEVYNQATSYDLAINSEAGVATFFWDKAAKIPEGVNVYYGELSMNEEEAVLNLKEIEGIIPANTAVIVSASDKETVTFESTDAVDAIKGNALKGSVTAISDYTAGSIYMLGNKNGLAFYQYAGTSIPANRAYLEIASEAEAEGEAESAPAIRVVFGGTSDNVTGIENIAIEAESVKAVFDLQGRRVLNMNRPGLYIVGGKKVLVK
jgi:hypothetical protein